MDKADSEEVSKFAAYTIVLKPVGYRLRWRCLQPRPAGPQVNDIVALQQVSNVVNSDVG